MSRARAAAQREPPRLNAFQLHYLNQVIPKYQTGPSFAAYDESLEAAYDWLCNFEDALKDNADAALLAKTPGKATGKKSKPAPAKPTGGKPLFQLKPSNLNVPPKPVAVHGPSKAAQKSSKPAAAPSVFTLPFEDKENSSTPKATVPSPKRPREAAVKAAVAAPLPAPQEVAVAAVADRSPAEEVTDDEDEAAVEHSISLDDDDEQIRADLPSSPVVVVVKPLPAVATETSPARSRASSFGQTDDDDKHKGVFGGKSRPASLFSQMSLASTAATSASEWEGQEAERRESKAERRESKVERENKNEDEDNKQEDDHAAAAVEDRLSTVKEVSTPPVEEVIKPEPAPMAPAKEVEDVAEATAPSSPARIVVETAVAPVAPSPPPAASTPVVVATEEPALVVPVSEDAAPAAIPTESVQPAPVVVAAAPAAPPKPSRPVRSSWLRSALGAEIGAPAGPGAGGARKSQGAALVAAAREREKEREREMAAVATSASASSTLATPSVAAGVKRKSDEAHLATEDTVEDEEDNTIRSALQRSTKILKLDDRPLPSASTLPSAQATSTTPFKRAVFSPPPAAEGEPEDGMSRVRKAMEELSARTKGRGMSTVGLGTLGGSILGNQTLVGRLTMPAGQATAGTPTFGSVARNGPGEDVATPTPDNAQAKQLSQEQPPVPTTEATPVQEQQPEPVAALRPPSPVPVTASAPAPAPEQPQPQERSFEIIDLTQSIGSLPPTPERRAIAAANDQANAPSSFGSLIGDLEQATGSSSPPPSPPPAAPSAKPSITAKAASSIFRAATPPKSARTVVDSSTTPMASPPKKRVSSNDGDLTLEDLEQSVVIDEDEEVRVMVNTQPKNRLASAGVPKMKEIEVEMEEEELIMDEPAPKAKPPQQPTADARSREDSVAPSGSKLKQSLSRSTRPEAGVRVSTTTGASRLGASTSSQGFSRIAADKIAGKKPKVDDVKSLQMAAEAAKKEQELKDRRAAVSKIAEANRLRTAAQKAAEEKAKEEEAKRLKMEEIKERKARAADVEKRRKEREVRDKEKRDALAAAKLAEEESRKRKMAPTAGAAPQAKRVQSIAGPSSVKVPTGKIATKMGMPPTAAGNKVVPSFNHLPPGPKAGGTSASSSSSQAGPSTIRLVGSSMGPPVRTSDMGKSFGPKVGPNAHRPSQAQGAQVLQAQRQALQSQMLSKSQGQQQSPRGERPGESEAIELADIDSEYSDSDDEDRPRSGKDAPAWAQSPEIRSALKQQEVHNPDEIFGRMKPLSMEEVFRARAGKFRARTSSANWTNDGVTPQEEMAYGRRMGWDK